MKAIISKCIHKKGEFTNGTNGTSVTFDSIIIEADKLSEIKVSGVIVEAIGHDRIQIKLKPNEYNDFFGSHPFSDIYKHVYDFNYDENGKIESIEFVK